eukprot:6815201-Pyramimonas_sp.AAC.1
MRAAPLGPSVKLPMGPRNVLLGVADACGHPHWGFRWSSQWGHETLYWVWRTHAGPPTGAFGGAPNGATKRCTGCGGRTRAPPMEPSLELPVWPRNV